MILITVDKNICNVAFITAINNIITLMSPVLIVINIVIIIKVVISNVIISIAVLSNKLLEPRDIHCSYILWPFL
jgi:hypothetical protein